MKKAKDIIDDPVKATLFGKFYEKVIAGWLINEDGFTTDGGKPRVYWKEVKPIIGDNESALKLNEVLIKNQIEKQRCIPDGLLQKDGKNYIWEAKNWPCWRGGKKPLDQLRETLFSMPLILTTKAIYKTKEKNIHGILFSWWSKPEGAEDLENEINNLIAPKVFSIYYTSEILEDCIQKKYPWYLDIIEKEEGRMKELFKDLYGLS